MASPVACDGCGRVVAERTEAYEVTVRHQGRVFRLTPDGLYVSCERRPLPSGFTCREVTLIHLRDPVGGVRVDRLVDIRTH